MPVLIVLKNYEPLDLNADLALFLDEKIPERFRDAKPQEEKKINKSTIDSTTVVGQLQVRNSAERIPGVDQDCVCLYLLEQFLKRDDESKSYKVFAELKEEQIPKGLTEDELKNPEEYTITFSKNYLT